MEIIQLPGYTEEDKLVITNQHIVERQMKENGITDQQIEFTDEGLRYLISHYTREAGLRNLEREVGSVCRKVAKEVVMGNKEKHVIDQEAVEHFLGVPRYLREEAMDEAQVGVATGLAWTAVGGEVLYIEAIKYKGKGGLVLTGRLGETMRESAAAALSYAKAHMKELNIPETWFEENEVHVHIPAGGTPKDGPSAGITMATALISLMTNTPIRKDVAMTGEVTLTGRVLPIGGLRDKALAALRHGAKDVIIPFQNVKDLADIPEAFRRKLNFIPVKSLDEVLNVALEKPGTKKAVTTATTPTTKDGRRPKVAAPTAS